MGLPQLPLPWKTKALNEAATQVVVPVSHTLLVAEIAPLVAVAAEPCKVVVETAVATMATAEMLPTGWVREMESVEAALAATLVNVPVGLEMGVMEAKVFGSVLDVSVVELALVVVVVKGAGVLVADVPVIEK